MPPAVPAPVVARARLLLLGLYALLGLMFSSWLARLPAVRDLLGLSTAQIGVILLVGSVGSLASVTASGAVIQRLGNRRAFVVSAVVIGAGYALMGLGPTAGSRALLAGGILLHGVGVALGNVVCNVESARIERAMGRTVIPQFHAAFSLGAVAGSALGALASRGGIPVGLQLPILAAVSIAWRLGSARGGVFLPALRDELHAVPAVSADAGRAQAGTRRRGLGRATLDRAPLGPWLERRTLLIGVVVLAASLSEGAANNWLSLAVVDGFAEPESVGGVVLGVFVGAMMLVRALGTRLIDRFGRVTVLRASALTSLVGLLAFGFAPALPVAVAGVALWGFGAALAVPIGIAAASDDPRRAAGRVAVVSAVASIAQLGAPPLLGLAAQAMGARHALVLVTAAMLLSAAVAGQVSRERRHVPRPSDEPAPAPADRLVPAATT